MDSVGGAAVGGADAGPAGLPGGSGGFSVWLNLRPHHGAGAPPGARRRELLAWAAAERRVHAGLVSDTAPGEPAAAALVEEVLAAGLAPVVSLSQAGRPRAALLAALAAYRAQGVRSVLATTGDHPAVRGEAPREFDLESVQLLALLAAGARAGGPLEGLRAGCVVSPFKRLEQEQLWQYEKLRRKAEAGAAFAVTQAGFDLRRYDELARLCRRHGPRIPLVAQALVADPQALRLAARGGIPGLVVPPEELARPAGARAALERAGRAVAVLRGAGYRAVLLTGGALGPAEAAAVLDEAERCRDGWEGLVAELAAPRRGFHYFRPAPGGLNADERAPLAPRRAPHPVYLFSWAVDYVAFGSWPPFFRVLVRVCRFCDPRPRWRRALWLVELAAKYPLYRCRMCGDCTLYACGFLCTEAGCPKRSVNGPCGGSADGWCEVAEPRRRCHWVRVHDRLKGRTAEPGFVAPAIPPQDRSLAGSCSWISFCLGRDHRRGGAAARAGIAVAPRGGRGP